MPIYEYECMICGTTFEKRQSFSEPPESDCPNGHGDTRRLLSAPAIVFKGSGFYINDSKGSKQSANGTTSSSGTATSSSAESESTAEKKDTIEKKPEKKVEAKSDS